MSRQSRVAAAVPHPSRSSTGQHPRHATGGLLIIGAVLLTVTGCRAGGLRTATADPAPAGASGTQPTTASSPAVPAPAATQTVAGAGTGGPGSLTVAFTQPVTVAGRLNTQVTCAVAGRRYVTSAAATINGYQVTDALRVAAYTGPGTYPAVLTVTLASAATGHLAADALAVTAEITASGGSVSFRSPATTAGRSLAGSITWACST